MVLTMTRERVAPLFGGGIRDKSETKTVVLPDPVGRETPMREAPERKESMQASRQDSWYGRKIMVLAVLDRVLRVLKQKQRTC